MLRHAATSTLLLAAFLAAIVASAAAANVNPPVLKGYTIQHPRDTVDICRQFAGVERDVPQQVLVQELGLPFGLLSHRHISLGWFLQLMAKTAPDTQIILSPLLFDATVTPLSSFPLPHLIHITVADKLHLQPHQVLAIASWARHNPGWNILLYDDADIDSFMITYYPQLLPTYNQLRSQVERTDLWRYLVLCTFGGVYADSDVVSGRPVKSWAVDAGLLVGVENVFASIEEAKQRTYTRQVQMVQWLIAARRSHPVVCRMGEYVRAHLEREAAGEFFDPDRDHAILERTGPGIWSSSVHDYLTEHNSSAAEVVAGVKVADMRVLPQPVLGCGANMYSPDINPTAYVYHMFKGTWRVRPFYPSWSWLLMEQVDSMILRLLAASGALTTTVGPSSSSSRPGSSSSSNSSKTVAVARQGPHSRAAAAAAVHRIAMEKARTGQLPLRLHLSLMLLRAVVLICLAVLVGGCATAAAWGAWQVTPADTKQRLLATAARAGQQAEWLLSFLTWRSTTSTSSSSSRGSSRQSWSGCSSSRSPAGLCEFSSSSSTTELLLPVAGYWSEPSSPTGALQAHWRRFVALLPAHTAGAGGGRSEGQLQFIKST